MTTITASSTVGITLNAPTYVSPVFIVSGVTISNNGNAIYAPAIQPWTLENSGTIEGAGPSGGGIALYAGGIVTNAASGLITGSKYQGIYITGAAGTVVNYGTVASTGSFEGIFLKAGGVVTNAASASIAGYRNGVAIAGVGGTVSNDGSIAGAGDAAKGVYLEAGGYLTNGVSGWITGGQYGVKIRAGIGTVVNAGSILGSAARGGGVGLYSGGLVSNAASGEIAAGYFNGIYVTGAAGTVVNEGQIAATAATADAIYLKTGGSVTNAAGGTISAIYASVKISGVGIVVNHGDIVAASYAGHGIDIGAGGAPGTVSNDGTIDGSGYRGVGVYLYAGGSITNAADGSIAGGADGILAGQSGQIISTDTVVNDGTIGGSHFFATGVNLRGAGSVTNAASAAIAGGEYGVRINQPGTVFNAGSIAGDRAVALENGGFVSNAASASIAGSRYGIWDSFPSSTVVNYGGIAGGYPVGAGVYLGGGQVTNGTLATIAGGYFGVSMRYTGTVINQGSIAATGTHQSFLQPPYAGAGVLLLRDGVVTNAASASITGKDYGVCIGFDGISTVTNYGVIAASSGGTLGRGVELIGNGSVTNAAGATISGVLGGIVLGNGAIVNHGVVSASGTAGHAVDANTLLSGRATVFNDGSIASAGSNGIGVVLEAGAGGTVINAGSISATGSNAYGIVLNESGAITNTAAGSVIGAKAGLSVGTIAATVINQGRVEATNAYGFGVNLGGVGSVTNDAAAGIAGGFYGVRIVGVGTIANSGSIAGTGVVGIGVALSGGGTVTNAGAIIGNSGTAVAFGGSGSNLLTLDPGYQLTGIALGSTTATDTLELASAASAGTLAGLGSEFVGFEQVRVDAGASWTWNGANAIAGGGMLTVRSGASLTDTGALTNNGSIVLDPSTLTLAGLIGTGTATIGAGSTLAAQGTIGSGETIVFGGAAAYLHLDAPGSAAGSVTNFDQGETIDLKGVDPSTVSYDAGVLSFEGGSFDLALAAAGPVTATASTDGAAVTVLCFCANTMILTPSGERPVQALAAGDWVTTARGAARRIAWVGAGRVLATRGRRNEATPVIVRKGALGKNVPRRDLRVTKGHSLCLDGVLIPVEFLVNHRTILWDDRAQEVSLYHIELETHDVLVADGAPAESYRDDGNRWLFQNANSGWHLPPQEPWAPVLTGGPIVDAIWRRLLDRAGPRPGIPTTDDPDLHLLMDGTRVDAVARRGNRHRFRIAAPAGGRVRIASRSGVPQELGIARDPRNLGVALRQVVVGRGGRIRVIEAADARLTEGFHPFEPDDDIRWTDGDAALPACLFDGFAGALDIVIQTGGSTRYADEGAALLGRATARGQ